MNKLKFLSTLLAAALFAASGLYFSDQAAAQDSNRERTVNVGPTATPTPTPAPTIDEDEPIKIETELVNLNVRVVDRSNRPINNLSQADFTVFEDNVAQQIEFFSRSEVPTNYSLVIDNSNSLRQQIEKVIEAGKILVNANRPEDETSIIRFVSSTKIEVKQPFTRNKTYLNETLDDLYTEGGQTAIIDAVYLAAENVNDYEKSVGPNDRKRRALIVVSDGEDRDSYFKEEQLFALLKEIDVQIYTIGFLEELPKEGGFIRKSPYGRAKNLLTKLAEETGGRAYFPTSVNELNDIAASISSEMRMQYSIGYAPTNESNDGTFRNIRVVIKDGPNRERRIAVTRTGRYATPTGAAPTLQRN